MVDISDSLKEKSIGVSEECEGNAPRAKSERFRWLGHVGRMSPGEVAETDFVGRNGCRETEKEATGDLQRPEYFGRADSGREFSGERRDRRGIVQVTSACTASEGGEEVTGS